MASSRSIKNFGVWMFVTSVLTSALLYVLLDQTHGIRDRQNRVAESKRPRTKTEQMEDLQNTIFLHPDRPPDTAYRINVTQSESISLVRDIPDTRPDACRAIHYDHNKLPRISIIIPFYNEALSLLLRTVHSILLRTTPVLLEEIILIDDHSHNKDLGATLDKYVSYLPKVKLIRLAQREGLIRARMIGVHRAKGEVIMFQDAHTENNVGWAEPILELIRKDRTTVVQPFIDGIDSSTIEYLHVGNAVPRVAFSWELQMRWTQMPMHEMFRIEEEGRKTHTDTMAVPYRTPIVVGCAMAVNKEYFLSIGGFDEGLNVWGGENIELGLQTWMCGGQVLTHPCSRVAHMFKEIPYNFDGDKEKIITKNLMRVAEVWMGDWKKYFLASTYTFPHKRTFFDERDLKSLDKRKALRKKLKCKPFDWYMQNIIPEIPIPVTDVNYFGEVTNLHTKVKWAMANDGYVQLSSLFTTDVIVPEFQFHIDKQGRLKVGEHCLRIEKSTWLVKYGECGHEQVTEKWSVERGEYDSGLIKVTFTGKSGKKKSRCVAELNNVYVTEVHYKESMPMLQPCDKTDKRMHWMWRYLFSWNYYWGPPGKQGN